MAFGDPGASNDERDVNIGIISAFLSCMETMLAEMVAIICEKEKVSGINVI